MRVTGHLLFSSLALLGIFSMVLFPLLVVAQDAAQSPLTNSENESVDVDVASRDSVLSPATPSFSVVFPFGGEVARGEVLFIAVPDYPGAITSASVSVDGVTRPFGLAPRTHWSAPWDTSLVSDGPYTAVFSFCIESVCEEKRMVFSVNNNLSEPATSDPVPTIDVPVFERPRDRDGVSETPDSSADVLPIVPVPAEIVIFPSNIFSLFELTTLNDKLVTRSAGEPLTISPDTYHGVLRVNSGLVDEVVFTSVRLNQDGQMVEIHLDEKVSPFHFRDVYYVPTSTARLRTGFASRSTRVLVPQRERRICFFVPSFLRKQPSV